MDFRSLSICAAGLTIALVAPAAAQMAKDAMPADSMKMSPSEMKTMKSCQKMSHTAMMKSKKCSAMMKMHPDMMKGDDAMMKK